ncbi:alpha/beta hydrolase family protein [Cricetibacter osteomyelitidis]|uniref:Alpha/beta hydrolase family protein n=1 Tax=Cricetibacter osteomyelitidis TaxID=1521931 RepID=A0A4R2TFL9_9PAST|nr:alpha/beta fold hydrolase [Cricetibacter osteomyelitidis]TCP95998.1 alpha/beta hydrolase family protein [Cricetibacter osteomyelitidis]
MKTSLKLTALFAALGLAISNAFAAPMTIESQGSFAVGGTVITSQGSYKARPDITRGKTANDFMAVFKENIANGGQTLHGDHATVWYQIPSNAKATPLVFLHGAGQSMRTWQTTPDGRDGWNNIFLAKNYPVYLVDQPRRGWSGRSTVDGTVSATPDEQFWFAQFRMGEYPNFFKGVAFPQDEASLNQFFRQMTPNTGAFDVGVISDSLKALFERIKSGVLVTHSQGGIAGWFAGIKAPEQIKAIVAIEPGNFPFPEGEVPPVIESAYGNITPAKVDNAQFARLTKMPIVIYFGDFISDKPSAIQGEDQWRIRLALAKQWAKVVNKHGGDVQVVHLPIIGIKGNTHFPMQDLNNIEVAEHLAGWLKAKGLDK